jgi:hypothetical protein
MSKYKLTIDKTAIDDRPEWTKDFIKNRARAIARLADLDAELNGGVLVEVCRVLGKPLYMRVDHHDPERATHDLQEMRSIVKDVVYPED